MNAEAMYDLKPYHEHNGNSQSWTNMNAGGVYRLCSCDGIQYQTAYRYDEALKALDEGIRNNPMSAALFLEKGRILYGACRYSEAVEALEVCVKLDPKSGDAYFQMGLAAWMLKDWDTARTSFVQTARLSERYHSQSKSVIDLLDDLEEEKEGLLAAVR